MSNTLDFARKATILVADDAADTRNLMLMLLENDYKVVAVDSGAEALRLVQTDTMPDLILLDIMMPEMDGYEVCRQLKANPRTRNIPVIFLSAMAGKGNEAQGRALGAVGFLTKPLDPQNVMMQVKGHFALRQKHRELEALKTASPPPAA
ncbi:MAG: response regulator [Gallionella sp.]|nr:response regulator [Gallionella sp.]